MDRENVIKGLEYLISEDCTDTQFDYEDEIQKTIELLKAQEPVEPIENAGFYYCGACRYAFTSARQKYCSECGKAVKWE